MTQPKRIQRRRVKGWRKPEGAVSVCRPGPWGNPWRIGGADNVVKKPNGGGEFTATEAVAMFERWVLSGQAPYTADDIKRELRGKDLMCFCALNQPCHADVLLRIANEEATQ